MSRVHMSLATCHTHIDRRWVVVFGRRVSLAHISHEQGQVGHETLMNNACVCVCWSAVGEGLTVDCILIVNISNVVVVLGVFVCARCDPSPPQHEIETPSQLAPFYDQAAAAVAAAARPLQTCCTRPPPAHAPTKPLTLPLLLPQHRPRNRSILPHTMASPNSPNVALPDPPGMLFTHARRRAALTLLLQRS